MRTGTALSVMLHSAVVAFALISWRSEPLEPPQEFNLVDVEMVTVSSETNIAPSPAPAPLPPRPAPPPPAPEPEAAPPPPPDISSEPPPPPLPKERPPEQQAALPPKTEPRPQAKPKPEPKDPEPKKPEPKKPEPAKPDQVAEAKPKDTKKTEKPKKPKDNEFNLDAIGAAADKLAKDTPKPERQASLPPTSSAPRAAVGQGTKMTATEIDLLRSTISKCWNMPAGAPNPETLVVRLKLFLNQDGTVARQPELIDTAGRAVSDPYFRAAAESAMRAVQICAPYQLPADKYDDWSEITINFRPPF